MTLSKLFLSLLTSNQTKHVLKTKHLPIEYLMDKSTQLITDVLVVGAGGAGMYAAIAAARRDVQVLLVDKNMIGRGGATIMAQMTVAAALSERQPDHWENHYRDTLEAGRGLCDPDLAELVCRNAPVRMREMDQWGVGWARSNGYISQVMAPGHQVARCCYVDFLNTGPAIARTLRRQVGRSDNLRRVSDIAITELIVEDGVVCGAVGFEGRHGLAVTVRAGSVVIATGGLTKLFSRSSASNNMSGEGYALGLHAGAELVDMEFVQFFPIGHLAPRMVGMDPIMWDPFRYKLGGRLLNGDKQPFMDVYASEELDKYTAPRDLATYAIYMENRAGRGSPHGGAWLSFAHIPERQLRDAFGPVIDRLASNGIDLTKQPVEVSPIAHYHMGGIKVDAGMHSRVPGLFAAGEAVGGASGANRLSGNAISEALVFGAVAGKSAAEFAMANRTSTRRPSTIDPIARSMATPQRRDPGDRRSATAMLNQLRQLMWQDVGPFRTRDGLQSALREINALQRELVALPVATGLTFANTLFDWYELRAALIVAESVATAALAREESRGAHQREDFPESSDALACHQHISLKDNQLKAAYV